jgi:acetyl esterase
MHKSSLSIIEHLGHVDLLETLLAKYPIALEQAYTATKWVAQNGKSINVDPSRMAVLGDSVGGNLTAALTLLAKERGGPSIRFQVLFYPVTDASFDTTSYMKYEQGYWLTARP